MPPPQQRRRRRPCRPLQRRHSKLEGSQRAADGSAEVGEEEDRRPVVGQHAQPCLVHVGVAGLFGVGHAPAGHVEVNHEFEAEARRGRVPRSLGVAAPAREAGLDSERRECHHLAGHELLEDRTAEDGRRGEGQRSHAEQ